jgi:hypothetical protein
MASTYSQYKIELIGTGDEAGQWGTITNNNFGSDTPGTYRGFEQAIGGRADVTMSSTTVTLSLTDSNDSQNARALYLNLSGTPGGAADLVVPALQKSCTVDGTDAVGFRNTPVNSQSADYTLLLADSGKTIFHPAADANDRTFTIPAESSVNYAVGTVVTFINLSANDLTIAITTDTMYLAGDGSTTSRTLAEYGVASAVKVASTTWVISGNGLT